MSTFFYSYCALKKQSAKQKQYNNNMNAKNIETLNYEENDIEVQVQNLWEVNYMFNKAGCGIPIDEVSLRSLTMNAMAQLNKFKSIRYHLFMKIKCV